MNGGEHSWTKQRKGELCVRVRRRTGSGAKEEDRWTAVGAEGGGPGYAA